MLHGVNEADAPTPHRRRILSMRVSELLECDRRALPLLIEHGFTPLENAALRAALAPTVRLSQALRLGGLSDDRRESLLARLEEVVPCP